MAYERYPRGDNNRYGNSDMDYGRDYGSGRDYTYSSARDYAAADDRYGRGQERGRDRDERYGARDYGYERYGQREQFGRNQSFDRGYGQQREQNRGDYGRSAGGEYHGSYASDGRRFEDVGRYRHADDDNYRGRQQQRGQRDYGRQPQGYDYEERGFFQRAGDEVRSWFGDDEAERRREQDARYDERQYSGGRHDDDYHGWRSSQVAAFDRDYDEYRRENRTKFENEFSAWRTNRQGQRDLLKKVTEHQEVVGSDGTHVGTVDKVRGDRIVLTKNDADAGGRHHSIPSSWISSVDDKVKLSKTAEEAKTAWRDEEQNSAMFGYGDNAGQSTGASRDAAGTTQNRSPTGSTGTTGDGTGNLNRSFSGTY